MTDNILLIIVFSFILMGMSGYMIESM